jgi:hypothetical protein
MGKRIFFGISAVIIVLMLVRIAQTGKVPAKTPDHVVATPTHPAPVAAPSTADAAAVSAAEDLAEPAAPATVEDAPATQSTAALILTGNLYQCQDPAGKMTVGKEPCAGAAQTIKVIPYSVQAGSNVIIPIDAPTAGAPQYVVPGPPSAAEAARNNCVEAKRYLQSEEQRLGFQLTIDQLRALNDHVYEACKGQ